MSIQTPKEAYTAEPLATKSRIPRWAKKTKSHRAISELVQYRTTFMDAYIFMDEGDRATIDGYHYSKGEVIKEIVTSSQDILLLIQKIGRTPIACGGYDDGTHPPTMDTNWINKQKQKFGLFLSEHELLDASMSILDAREVSWDQFKLEDLKTSYGKGWG